MNIAVLDDYQNVVSSLQCFPLLKNHSVKVFNNKFTNDEELIASLKQFEAFVLIRERTILSSAVLSKLPKLRVISQTGRAGDHIDQNYCKANNISVLSGSGNPVAPAELTWALIMSAQRRLPLYMHSLQKGQWQSENILKNDLKIFGRSLKGKILGIFGLGKIGSMVAQFGKAFQMDILVFGQENSRKKALELNYRFTDQKKELFETSDILTLHLRLTEKTQGIVSLTDLKSMKPDSTIVNTSRSQLLERNSMNICLEKNIGPLFFAFDVFDVEPLNSFTENNRCIFTPHIGFCDLETYEMYFSQAFQNILDYESMLK